MLRTQIYLPEELRKAIDQARRDSGKSVAGYIRQATAEKLEKDKKQKDILKKLAQELGAGVKKSGWEGIDVIKWQREIRKDRKIIK